MSTTSLVQVLQRTVSSDKHELLAAQKFLEQGLQTNPAEFIKALSDILADPSNDAVARTAAGLQIKNALTSKDDAVKEMCQQRWLAFPEDIRRYIKENVLKSIGTETSRPSSAAQCVAFIALTEIPIGSWREVLDILCSNIISDTSTEQLQEASLEALGYICQDIDINCITPFSNTILTAIVHGMRKGSSNRYVGLAATTALLNSLEFTKANFEKEMERNYLMEVVCETTQSKDPQIRVAALQCLVKIMSLYYEFMDTYMAQALFPITMEAMKSDVDVIALQGIEFWSNVCDEEITLSMEDAEGDDLGQVPPSLSRNYAKGALQYLVPILMQKLTQQEEQDDEDEWNPSKAASVCLLLLVSCCGQDVLPHVLPFVKENIKNPDWRYRDASLLAFGSVLRGMDSSVLKPIVDQAIPTIIDLMYDTSVAVRDTAAWTIGQICENVWESAINEIYLKSLLEAMVHGLKAEPRVAANICWAFVELAKASYEAAGVDADVVPATTCLSQYFDLLVEKLLETTTRNDGSEAKLRLAAYEALMEMIKNSPRDCYGTVQKTTIIILERLSQVLSLGGQLQTHSNRADLMDLQGLLCATLQSVLGKVIPEDAPKISDQIMSALLQMFISNSDQAGGVHEEAMRAVSTLIEVLGEGFVKYLDSFKPFLMNGLKNHTEYQICLAAVGVVADLCREVKTAILPFCDEIMTLLLQNLSDNSVHRSVKPQILSVLGDIALAVGPAYQKYLDVVLTILVQASQIQVDRTDYDMVEYLNELRESILSAYTGIIQGMNTGNAVSAIEPHLPFVLEFIKVVARDSDNSDDVTCACVALIGDLCSVFGSKITRKLDMTSTNEILQQARRSVVRKTKNYGVWVSKELRKLTRPSCSLTDDCGEYVCYCVCDEMRIKLLCLTFGWYFVNVMVWYVLLAIYFPRKAAIMVAYLPIVFFNFCRSASRPFWGHMFVVSETALAVLFFECNLN